MEINFSKNWSYGHKIRSLISRCVQFAWVVRVFSGLLILSFMMILFLGVRAAQAQPNCPEAEYGLNVDRSYFSSVLGQLSIPESEFALDAFQAWQRRENTRACWNPLATTLPAAGSTDFNSKGVKNYPDRATGARATADTLLFTHGGTGNAYRAIREFLAQRSFDRQALVTALNTWTGSNGYGSSLTSEWETLWNAGATLPPTPQPGNDSCTVALDPGHGGPDSGASWAGVQEKDVVWNVANITRDRLLSHGYTIVLTRPENADPSFQDRWAVAVRADADFLVSIHTNSAKDDAGNPIGDGVEAWYQEIGINPHAAQSRRLAELLADSVSSRSGLRNRGVKSGKALYSDRMPAALIELAFLSNDNERQMLVNSPGLFADAVAEAIVSYGNTRCNTIPPPDGASTDTIMVFDTSGSMQGAKIQGAKRAGNNVLDIISSENEAIGGAINQVALVHFNNTAGIDAPLSPDIEAARSALQGMVANGRTAMPDGLRLGINALDGRVSRAKPIIILLSDGLPNVGLGSTQADGPVVRQQVLDLATEAGGKGFCIYTVGFGTGTDIDEGLLRDVAQRSGCGDYYGAQNVSQLANVYVQLRHASTGEIRLQQTGNIAQGEQLTIGMVNIPRHQAVLLYTLNWPGSQLDPVIIDPDGQPVDANYPKSSITTKSSIATVIVNNPPAGDWQVGATGTDVPEGTTTYHAVLSTRIALGTPLSMTPLWIMLGGMGLVTAALWMRAQRSAGWCVQVEEENGSRYRVKVGRKGIWIGREPQCDIHLNDPAVSRRHAWIGPSPRGKDELFVRDEESRIGTKRNDKKVKQAGLSEADEVTIGKTRIRPMRTRSS